jgi:glycosyltransferase involved in cell wall biosynthesis
VGGLGPIRSGVARYVWSSIAAILKVEPAVELILYSNVPVDVPLPGGNWRLRVDKRAQRMPHFLWLQNRCPQLLADDGVDAFWGQNWLMPLSLRRRIFRLLTVHDAATVMFPRTASRSGRLVSRLYFRRAVRAADCIVAVSHATARLARLCLGATPGRVRVVYQGFADVFRPAAPRAVRAVATDKYGLPSEYLLTVGNIEPRKDHLTLLNAIGRVRGAPVLVIVGGVGWRCREIVEAIVRFEKAGRVRFLGRVDDDDLAALYTAAKLSIYPSFYEGFGLPVVEAMACGCPVLCSWSSSLPEAGGMAARYFRPHNAADLAGRIEELLSGSRVLMEMREQGFVQAAKFSYDAAAGQLLRLLPGAPNTE